MKLKISSQGRQTLCVSLSENVARRARAHVQTGLSGYSSLNEFVEVAIENLLNVEDAPVAVFGGIGQPQSGMRVAHTDPASAIGGKALDVIPQGRPARWSVVELPATSEHVIRGADIHPLLVQPTRTVGPGATPASPATEPLFVLTNRLSPVKVAARVLANLQLNSDRGASLSDFQRLAGEAARLLGLWLRIRDSSRAPEARRWVAYPVGDDPAKSIARFIKSFTIAGDGGSQGNGTLAQLGLAALDSEFRVQLTAEGWHMASLPSPLLEGTAGETCSPDESRLLRDLILARIPREVASIREFLELVRRSNGRQSKLDELLNRLHPDWTANLVVARRAALAGRLSDMEVVRVAGRGNGASIQLLPAAQEFIADQS